VNVSGVGTTPPPPPLPPVAPPRPAAEAPTSENQPRPRTGGRTPQRERPTTVSTHEAPSLRMITVTEMRVMLGQLPASAAFKLEQHHTDPSAAS
jgi:hypothetical protein